MLYTTLAIFSFIVFAYGIYFALIGILGHFKPRRTNPLAHPTKRIAVLVPARNEGQVIGQLVDSLMMQRYPRELYDVFVVANNCTDNTAQIAERSGARVMVCEQSVRSKGEVLRYAFDKLQKLDGPAYDAYCIFDADNLVDGGFLQAANNALCAGYHIAQAYRDSKNPSDNWVTGCTSVFFWFMSRLYNDSRCRLGISASLNGTGIVISDQLFQDIGYNTFSLTEDQEYTAQCILAGYKIGYMDDAIIYDEQPLTLKDSFTQRRRWGAGTLQCSKKYLLPLLKKAFAEKNADALDISMLFIGLYIQLISCMPTVLTIAACISMLIKDPVGGFNYVVAVAAMGLFFSMVSGFLYVFILVWMEQKFTKVTLSTYFMMCIYLLTWVPANLACLFTRLPEWTMIQHVSAVDIAQCEAENEVAKSGARKLRHSKETGA